MTPEVRDSCFVAEDAVIIGDVVIDDGCSIWPNAVIRGDENSIKIGEGTNIQDCAVVHVDNENATNIGKNVSIGHCAIVHGATIGDEVIIGMNASVLSGAVIGSGCIIGANALVTPGMKIPDNSLAVGVPAKIIKEDEELREMALENADHYFDLRDEHDSGKYERY